MYKRILVPFDGSATSRRCLDEAVKLSKLSGASIHLVHVLDRFVFTGTTPEVYTVDALGVQKEAGARILEEAKARVAESGVAVTAFLSEPLPGRVCDVVSDQARESAADLIVLGTHGRRGIGRLLVGSDAEQILRLAPVPVLLVRS